MKTIVLFFLLVAFAAASRNKHKTKASDNDDPESSADWPRPDSIGEFNVPPEYGGSPPTDGDEPAPPAGNDPPRRHPRSGRRH